MTVTHFVTFKLKPEVASSEEKRHKIHVDILDLKTTCLKEGAPYILELTGGKQCSPEGLDKGFDLGYVVTFATISDRDYYLDECPTHQEFKKNIKPLVEDVFVFDYEF